MMLDLLRGEDRPGKGEIHQEHRPVGPQARLSDSVLELGLYR
jgi:hypothetical protein